MHVEENCTISGISIVALNNQTVYDVEKNQTVNVFVKIMSDNLTLADNNTNKTSIKIGNETYNGTKIGINETDGSYYVNYTTPDNNFTLPVNGNYTMSKGASYMSGVLTSDADIPDYITLTAPDVIVKYFRNETQYTVNLTTQKGKPVSNKTINITFINSNGVGKNYTIVTNANGTATLVINANPGKYKIIAYFENQTVTTNVTVKPVEFTIQVKNIVMNYKDGTNYTARFSYGNQTPLSNTEVNVIINKNGKYLVTYSLETNANGTVTLPINLYSAVYSMTASFLDTSITTSLNVLKEAYTIEAKDVIKYYHNGTQYTVKVTNLKGTPLANVNITVTLINAAGKHTIYHIKTNSNGVATLPINLYAGEYTIQAKIGDNMVQSRIIVLPTLTCNDLVKIQSEPSYLRASLVDGEGEPIRGKNITFNVKGKEYTRVTDSHGVASLFIGLDPGNYNIKVTDTSTGAFTNAKVTVKQ